MLFLRTGHAEDGLSQMCLTSHSYSMTSINTLCDPCKDTIYSYLLIFHPFSYITSASHHVVWLNYNKISECFVLFSSPIRMNHFIELDCNAPYHMLLYIF